jgi:hypothetical protein
MKKSLSDSLETQAPDPRLTARVYKKVNKEKVERKKKKMKVSPVTSLPRVQSRYDGSDNIDDFDKSDKLVDSVNTQDLPTHRILETPRLLAPYSRLSQPTLEKRTEKRMEKRTTTGTTSQPQPNFQKVDGATTI